MKLADGPTVKIDPWSIVFTDLDTGSVLDVVDGRRGTAVRWWLCQRPPAWRDRVQIVAEYDRVVRSQRSDFRIPSVVVLKDYVKPQKRVAFTRFNLFLRDEFCCQYCGSKGDLTFDHVIPRWRGGDGAPDDDRLRDPREPRRCPGLGHVHGHGGGLRA